MAFVGVLAGVGMAGCSQGEDRVDSLDSESVGVVDAGEIASEDVCSLADDDVIEALAQSEVLDAESSEMVGMPRCVFTTSDGGRVQVLSAESSVWARQLPEMLDSLEVIAGQVDLYSDDDLAKLEIMRDQLGDDSMEPCTHFSVMAELQGVPPGGTQVVNIIPDDKDPQAVNGQKCTDGLYTSVQLQTPGIVADLDTLDRIVTALDALHTAGLQR